MEQRLLQVEKKNETKTISSLKPFLKYSLQIVMEK